MKRSKAQVLRHASSVRAGTSKGSFGLSPRKCLSFCEGRLSPLATPCDPAFAKSGQNAAGIVSIVIVGSTARVHNYKVIAIVVIRRAQPRPDSTQAHTTPKAVPETHRIDRFGHCF